MEAHAQLEALFAEHGVQNFQWINPKEIVVAQWVRMKCAFGCPDYGRNASCPPNIPTVPECRLFFDEYQSAAIFHFAKQVDRPEDRTNWAKKVNLGLLELERAVFLAGYRKAFMLFLDNCHLCADCSGERTTCKSPKQARPAPEAMAVDVFATVRKVGYPIEVLSDYDQTMNRYAILMVY